MIRQWENLEKRRSNITRSLQIALDALKRIEKECPGTPASKIARKTITKIMADFKKVMKRYPLI